MKIIITNFINYIKSNIGTKNLKYQIEYCGCVYLDIFKCINIDI
jgi:hypothetical protein